jgi:hypothetical protein
MRKFPLTVPFLSLCGGFVGAALFQVFAVGMTVEAEPSPHMTLDSVSVKQLVLFNEKNETIAKLTSDQDGLPTFHMGKSDRGHIDLSFVSENQPSVTVTGGLGQSISSLAIKNVGTTWEPTLTLGHKDQNVGVLMSVFHDAGNIMLSNKTGETLRLDASQGSTWRKVALNPFPGMKEPNQRSRASRSNVRYSTIKAQ